MNEHIRFFPVLTLQEINVIPEIGQKFQYDILVFDKELDCTIPVKCDCEIVGKSELVENNYKVLCKPIPVPEVKKSEEKK